MDSKKKIIRVLIVIGVVFVGVVAFYVGSIFLSSSDENNAATETTDEASSNETSQTGEGSGEDSPYRTELKDNKINVIIPGNERNEARLKDENKVETFMVSLYTDMAITAFSFDDLYKKLYFVEKDSYKIYVRDNLDVAEYPTREIGQLPTDQNYDEIRFMDVSSKDDLSLLVKTGDSYYYFDVKENQLQKAFDSTSVVSIVKGKAYFLKNEGSENSEIWSSLFFEDTPKMVLKKPNIRFFVVEGRSILWDDTSKLYRYDLLKKEDYIVFEDISDPSYTISKSEDVALIRVNGKSFIYRFPVTEDPSLSELAFLIDPKSAFWSLNGKQIYNVKGEVLYRYDIESKTSQQWNLISSNNNKSLQELGWSMQYGSQQVNNKKKVFYLSYGVSGVLLSFDVIDEAGLY